MHGGAGLYPSQYFGQGGPPKKCPDGSCDLQSTSMPVDDDWNDPEMVEVPPTIWIYENGYYTTFVVRAGWKAGSYVHLRHFPYTDEPHSRSRALTQAEQYVHGINDVLHIELSDNQLHQ